MVVEPQYRKMISQPKFDCICQTLTVQYDFEITEISEQESFSTTFKQRQKLLASFGGTVLSIASTECFIAENYNKASFFVGKQDMLSMS